MLTMQIPAVLVTSESPSLGLVGLLVLEQGAGLHPPPWSPLGSARAPSRLVTVLWTFLVLRNQCEVWFLEWDHWCWELDWAMNKLELYMCLKFTYVSIYICECKIWKGFSTEITKLKIKSRGCHFVSHAEHLRLGPELNHGIKALFESWSRDQGDL